MKEDDSRYEQIDFYLKEKLSQEELLAFQQAMQQDESLRDLVEAQRIANDIIMTKQLLRLKAKINQDLKSQNDFGFKNWILLSIFMMVGTGLTLYFLNTATDQSLSGETIKTTNVAPPSSFLEEKNTHEPITTTDKSSNPSSNNEFKSAPHQEINSSMDVNTNSLQATKEEVALSPANEPITEIQLPVSPEKPLSPDCSKLAIQNAIVTTASCAGQQNGKIQIIPSKISGGSAPYLFSITKKTTYSNEVDYAYLNAGTYLVSIQDNNRCISQHTVEIEEKVCAPSHSFAFSPDFEKWEIPVKENKQGEVNIFNKSGILVHRSKIGLGHENTWDGKSLEGVVNLGYYVYIIKYNDGEEERGSVTIQ